MKALDAPLAARPGSSLASTVRLLLLFCRSRVGAALDIQRDFFTGKLRSSLDWRFVWDSHVGFLTGIALQMRLGMKVVPLVGPGAEVGKKSEDRISL